MSEVVAEAEISVALTGKTAGPTAAQSGDLDRSLLRGIAWTGGVKSFVQALSWSSTLVVARLLSPTDYGITGMAAVYIGLVQIVNEFGLGAAIVQRRDLNDTQIAQLGGLSIGLGAVLCAISLGVAPLVARFFGQPAVTAVIMVLSLTFVTSAFQVLPRSLLTRELQFGRLAALEGAEALTGVIVTLALALSGARYWSLVIGVVCGRFVSTALALAWRGHRLGWPFPLADSAGHVRFGSHVAVSSIAWYAFRNADMLVVGRWIGDKALGAYTVAWNLASLPVDRITTTMVRATPAIFARVQDDPSALQRYLLAMTEGIALLTVPAAVGIALVARDFAVGVLGPVWLPAVGALRVLALAAIFRSAAPLMNQVLVATDQARRNMQATVTIALVLPGMFMAASRWGISGVALVWLCGFPIVSFVSQMRYALATCRLSVWTYAKAFWPAVSGALVMTVAVVAIRSSLVGAKPVLRLIVQVVIGALTYAAVVVLMHKPRLLRFQSAIRALR